MQQVQKCKTMIDKIELLKLEIELKEQLIKDIQRQTKILEYSMYIVFTIFMLILACSGGL